MRKHINYLSTKTAYVRYSTTPSVAAAVAMQCAARRSAANMHLHSAAQHVLAHVIKQQLSKLFNCVAYVNVRKRFIAIKLQHATTRVTNARSAHLLALANKHNAQIVYTSNNGIILRLYSK